MDDIRILIFVQGSKEHEAKGKTSGYIGYHATTTNNFFTTSVNETDHEWLGNKHQCFLYEGVPKAGCPQNFIVTKEMKIFIFVADTALAIVSAGLLLGVSANIAVTATIFLYVYSFSRVVDILLILVQLCMGLLGPCVALGTTRFNCVVTFVFSVVISIYVLVVVKSLRSSFKYNRR